MGMGMKVLNNIAGLNVDHLTQKKYLSMLNVKYVQNLSVTFDMKFLEPLCPLLAHPTVVSDDVSIIFL